MKFSRWGGGTGIGFLETSLLFCRSYFITTRIANTCEAAEAMKILGNRFLWSVPELSSYSWRQRSCPLPRLAGCPPSPLWRRKAFSCFYSQTREACVGNLCVSCVSVSVSYCHVFNIFIDATHVLEAVEAVTGSAHSPICLCTLLTDLVPHSQKRKALTPQARTQEKKRKKISHHVYKHWITMSDSRACIARLDILGRTQIAGAICAPAHEYARWADIKVPACAFKVTYRCFATHVSYAWHFQPRLWNECRTFVSAVNLFSVYSTYFRITWFIHLCHYNDVLQLLSSCLFDFFECSASAILRRKKRTSGDPLNLKLLKSGISGKPNSAIKHSIKLQLHVCWLRTTEQVGL